MEGESILTTSDELHTMISQRENVRVDFKADATEDVLRGLSTDISSFANTQGGTIIFGVTDEGDPVGCKLTQTQRDRISQEASKCHPIISVDLEEVSFGARKFVLVKIPKGNVIHNDQQRRFPTRVGNITDYLDASGLVSLLQERAIIRGEMIPQIQTQGQSGRKPLAEQESSTLVKMLGSPDKTIRLEALKDLATMPYWNALLEDESIASSIGQILSANDEEEVKLVLESFRGIAHAGSEKEKAILRGWFPKIEELGNSSSLDLARKSFDVLQSARSPRAVKILLRWVREAEDSVYNALQLSNFLSNVGYYALKSPARQALYGLLENDSDERTRKRSIEVLEILRRIPGE